MTYYVTCRLHGPIGGPFPNRDEAEDARVEHLDAYSFPHGAEVLVLSGKDNSGSIPFQEITILDNLRDHTIDKG